MRSAKDLLEIWNAPPAEFRSAPFWSWNDELDPLRLCRQIDSMHAAGMGGFFMHSRYGLKTPYLSDDWFACVTVCIERAAELGMKAYLYDEDRWPSGPAGGIVTRDNPEYAKHVLTAGPPAEEGEAVVRQGVFAVNLDEQGRLVDYQPVEDPAGDTSEKQVLAFDVFVAGPAGQHNDAAYLDTMNGEAVEEFIHVTHQAYADRYSKHFGGVIPAIFTDEPNYGGWGSSRSRPHLQWTPNLPREFRRRRGYDLRDHLPELVYPTAAGFSKVRYDYRRTLTELFVESFTRQIGIWCGKHNISLTGHMLEEPTLSSQVKVVGACMPHYEHMQWPGIDMLTDQADELTTAKQCSSVADQLGRDRVLSELYGCTGWDWPLEGHKFVGDWQFACGVNFRCPHLTHYSLAGGAKRDYPASIFAHSPWWDYYNVVEDYFARLGFMLTRGKPIRDVLVVHPVESAWGLMAPGEDGTAGVRPLEESLERLIRTLSGRHWDWDFGDESLLEKYSKVSGDTLSVGEMSYKLVVVPPCETLRSSTVELLKRFAAQGGAVMFIGEAPRRVDAVESRDALELAADVDGCQDDTEQISLTLGKLLDRRVSLREGENEAEFVWSMLRDIKGGRVLFCQSHDRKQGHRLTAEVEGAQPVLLWDPRTGRISQVESEQSGNRVRFELDLPPTGSALVTLGVSHRDAEEAVPEPTIADSRSLSGPFPVELVEPNTMPLDYCRFRTGDGQWSQPVPTLKADTMIREHFGLGERGNKGPQPWYLYRTGVLDTAPRGRCEMAWDFHVTTLPPRCMLALERPGDFKVSVNGKAAGGAKGFWVDEDIRTIDITALLVEGDNEVRLTFDYRPDMELEDMYLVGEFGVRPLAGETFEPGNLTLVEQPTELSTGSWLSQGLPFYGGAVRYRIGVEKPASGRVRLRLDKPAATAVAVHAGGRTWALPWPPFVVDITDGLSEGENEVVVEAIAGRKNILGPLHTPWERWTGPGEFHPDNPKWSRQYRLNDHGLMGPPVVEVAG
ncbi:MAG: glycosyl hydrolase [Phycisphaerae bacterium]